MKKRLILTFNLATTFVSVQVQRNEVVAAAGDYFKTGTWLDEFGCLPNK